MTRFRLTWAAVIALVGLRVLIGWHFYQEGVVKLQGGYLSSGTLFASAKGPLAPVFRYFVWDPYGIERLNAKETERAWNGYRDKIAKGYGLEEEARKKLQTTYDAHRREMREYFEELGSDIGDYVRDARRLQKYQGEAVRNEVPGLRAQLARLDGDLKRQGGPWLAKIDSFWVAYEKDMLAVVTEANGKKGPALKPLGARPYDTRMVDKFIPYFDAILGGCLMLGFFTRTVAWIGAAFLASIIASQWPGTPEAMPTYYQSIECVGLVVVATVGAGRFGSVDAMIAMLRGKCCRPRTESTTPPAPAAAQPAGKR